MTAPSVTATLRHPCPAPVVFVGHGSPMNAIEDNTFSRAWRALGEQLPRPKAVLCVSAHWETRGVRITSASHPSTIHDFYGFPKALFDVQYPAPGDPELARRVETLLGSHGHVQADATRGLDHGAWSVLRVMYPDADVPVVQLGIDTTQPGEYHYRLAQALAPLRDEGVLVLGSGNIVHNLSVWNPRAAHPLEWAQRFDESVKHRIRMRDHAALADWPRLGIDARTAIPTPEHYLPLLYVLALQRDDDRVDFFNEVVISSIGMTSLVIAPVAADCC
ncbi:MAG: 4,5-DOPA dioxygenase extradiol [Lysobacteraceae bacterium]